MTVSAVIHDNQRVADVEHRVAVRNLGAPAVRNSGQQHVFAAAGSLSAVRPQCGVCSSTRNSTASACPLAMECTDTAAPVWFCSARANRTMLAQHSSLGLTTDPMARLSRILELSRRPSLVITCGTPRSSRTAKSAGHFVDAGQRNERVGFAQPFAFQHLRVAGVAVNHRHARQQLRQFHAALRVFFDDRGLNPAFLQLLRQVVADAGRRPPESPGSPGA